MGARHELRQNASAGGRESRKGANLSRSSEEHPRLKDSEGKELPIDERAEKQVHNHTGKDTDITDVKGGVVPGAACH